LHYNNSYYYNQNLIHYESLFNELKLESYDDVFNRTKYNLHNILKYSPNPLIISHKSTITILFDSLNISYNKNEELDYASISYGIYDKNNRRILIVWLGKSNNDTIDLRGTYYKFINLTPGTEINDTTSNNNISSISNAIKLSANVPGQGGYYNIV
jgi:broad specificity phosphatase PhoE